jgi:hypothetical protein
MGREGALGRRDGEGTAHGFPFAPSEVEIAALCIARGRLAGRGTRREEVFAEYEASSE